MRLRILVLVNWKVKKIKQISEDLQAPDYYSNQEKYWFFKYFPENTKIDVIDIKSFDFWEKVEKNKLHFHIVQAIKAIFKIRKYDIVISHGMPSGILLALFRRIFKTKAKHIVFDIGSFNSAAETGKVLKLNQFASKSIDGLIYHTSKQIEYYEKFYPWLVEKSKFIPFGTDVKYFKRDENKKVKPEDFIISIGRDTRDFETMIKAFENVKSDIKLKMIGPTVDLKINDKRIEIIGETPKRKLNLEIQKARFAILPLEYKKFSFGQMTLLQQMYYGKAIIVSKVPSVIDYIEDGETGILYEPENVKDLSDKIKLLIEDDNLRKRIGKNAKIAVEKKYNEKRMGQEVYQFVKEIIKEG